MRAGRTVAGVVAVLMGLLASGLVFAGTGLLWAHGTQRDAGGFFTTSTESLSTDTYALTSSRIDLGSRPGDDLPADRLATVLLEAAPADGDRVFVGVGPADEVESYLDGVAHAEVGGLGPGDDVTARTVAGGAPGSAPSQQSFWEASAEGAGTQALTWDVGKGQWIVVVMNADASAGVTVDALAGATSDLLVPVALAMLGVGLLVGAVLLVVAVRWWGGGTAVPAAPGPGGAYPARLEARLDPHLSRWRWLVKWILALPHYVVLAILWPAFVLLTVVAGVAILLTGRYPRPIFDFNVGVVRWTWRVAYYAWTGLGTDRYPPFTLAQTDYPATFEVAYPQQLSRGLALVKWWLLAIPHYLVVGVLTSSVVLAAELAGSRHEILDGGLIGLLSLIAVVTLAVTGRYPQGLFDLVVGLSRWVFRVTAYATLMTDEYPPFRLDGGGADSGITRAAAPPSPTEGGDATATEPDLSRS